jgi:hypothetical protein
LIVRSARDLVHAYSSKHAATKLARERESLSEEEIADLAAGVSPVEVEECFLQCAKALLRSKLWESHERPNLQSLPCAAEMFHDHLQMPEFDVAKLQTLLDEAYRNKLY